MSKFYNPKRTRNIYGQGSEIFKLSRSKVDLFVECPKCFYLDRKLGVGRPPGYPFSLNSAVDTLLKKEFDIHRAKREAHPLMEEYGLDAIPYEHPDLNKWRDTFVGVQYFHEPTGLMFTGAVDDVWVKPKGELIVVDYKATAKEGEVSLDADWQDGYKRQMEFYQWLLRQNDFDVSDTGYFVYVNGKTDRKAFDGKLEFDIKLIPYEGNGSWIEGTLLKIKKVLDSDNIPNSGEDCDYCRYVEAVEKTNADTN